TGKQTSLWVSDGTAGGTKVVSEPLPAPTTDHSYVGNTPIYETADKIYAWLYDSAQCPSCESLSVIDKKTRKLTVLVNRIDAGWSDNQILDFGGKIYFSARGREEMWTGDVPLWVSDGTPQGTHRFASADGGSGSIAYRHAMFSHRGKKMFY